MNVRKEVLTLLRKARNKKSLGNMAYTLTEEEIRVLRECNNECFWYRSLPLSAVGMLMTQMLIKKGFLTTSSRFGSLPKVAFAGFCGYFGGKISYVKACQEKLEKLENSPLGEALRQQKSTSFESNIPKKEFPYVPSSSPFESSPGAGAQQPSMYSGYSREVESSPSKYEPIPFSSSMNESTPTGITDSIPQEPGPLLEDSPKRKEITYDELRSRNRNRSRELFEIRTMQNPELPSRSPQERLSKKEVKVNKYGDAWEE